MNIDDVLKQIMTLDDEMTDFALLIKEKNPPAWEAYVWFSLCDWKSKYRLIKWFSFKVSN